MILAAVLEAMGHFCQDDFAVENTASQQWTFSVANYFFLIKMMLIISFQKRSDKSMPYRLGEKNGMRTPVSPIV